MAKWHKPELQAKQYSKMLVYVLSPTLATRATMETRIAEDFTSYGLPAFASSDKYLQFAKPDSVLSPQNLLESARKDSFDIMLALRLGDSKEGMKQTYPGFVDYSKPGNMWGSGNTERVTVTNIESQLIDAKTGDLLYTVDAESEMSTNDNVKDAAKSLSPVLVHELVEGGALILPKESKD